MLQVWNQDEQYPISNVSILHPLSKNGTGPQTRSGGGSNQGMQELHLSID